MFVVKQKTKIYSRRRVKGSGTQYTRTEKRRLGDLGEDIAVEFLMKHGFSILKRNYLKKCGEIDIVAQKSGVIVFFEVKSVSVKSIPNEISHETDSYRPEDNLHRAKISRIAKTAELYMSEIGDVSREIEWRIDALIVYIDNLKRLARVKHLPDIS
jgi:putative endonuclease